MRRLFIRGIMVSPIIVILVTANLRAQTFIYANNNPPFVDNSVTAFSVGTNGMLTVLGTFPTGGQGSGGGTFASNRARISTVGARLYVTNDASNSISGFDINTTTGMLMLVPGSPFSTGPGGPGFSDGISIDCTPGGQFLIAANKNANNITVFSIGANGALAPIPGSPFPAGGEPHGVRGTPNGQFLSVALNNIDSVGMFSIAADGALTPVPGSPFASPAFGLVAGVEVNGAGNVLLAAQETSSGTNVDVFSIAGSGALTLFQTSNNPAAGTGSSVALLSPNQQFLFITNQLSSSVTVFNVAASGMLTLVPGSPFGGTGFFPAGEVTNAAGTLLFAANNDGTVSSFGVGLNGALTLVGNFPTGHPHGLRSVAAFPPATFGAPFTVDVCLQDDSSPNVVFIGNSQTGEYLFCSGGTTFAGTASVTRRGSVITFQHNTADRRVLATDDQSVHKGKASLQTPLGTIRSTITDRNTTNNTCACQ